MSRASEWKKKAREAAGAGAVELTLPSGAKILARRPNPVQLATWGKLPMLLANAAHEAMAGRAQGAPTAPQAKMDEVAEIATLYRDLLVHCCVNPRISLEPTGDDEIHPRDIPEEDWTYITHWAMRVGEARALASFRGQRADAGSGGDGEGVRAAAVGADGNPGRGAGLEF